MNRFDRVTSILLLLQTRPVVTAGFLAARFGVSERTIYRDIRSLETAGVPIGSEAGVGYSLERSYRLPPVRFTLDEAAALLLGQKLLASSLDDDSRQDFERALDKVRAVIDGRGKDHLQAFDADLEVRPSGRQFPVDETAGSPTAAARDDTDEHEPGGGRPGPGGGDRWLRDCRRALVQRHVVEIDYAAVDSDRGVVRQVEPIGLFYYSWHWHLIGWCRLREDYRDFRLDRVSAFSMRDEPFDRHARLTLRRYLDERPGHEAFEAVELVFGPATARFVDEQRHLFGFVDEERHPDGVTMRFLTPVPEYMARWLLQYTDDVRVVKGDSIRDALRRFSAELAAHWSEGAKGS